MILVGSIAALGILFLTVVYLRDSRLQLWPKTKPPYGHEEYIRDVREALEANDDMMT